MKILPSFSKRAYVLSGTLLALLAVFIFYLYIYIPKREEELIRQRIRGLEQTALNFQAKWAVYKKNAEKIIYQYEEDPENDFKRWGGASFNNRKKLIEKEIEEIQAQLDSFVAERDKKELLEKKEQLLLKLQKEEAERLKEIIFRSGLNVNLEVGSSESDVDKNLVFVQNSKPNFVIKTSVDRFLESLKRPNDFDDYFIYKDEVQQPVYQSRNGGLFLVKEEFLDSENAKEKRKLLRSEEITQGKIFSGVENVKLGATAYKLFSTRFHLNNSDWYLYGLVSAERFNAEKRRIPSILIISFLVPLLLLLFSMPLLKLFFMSPIERVHQTNVVYSAISFILSLSLLVIIILSLDSFLVDEKNQIDKNLKKLSNRINHDFEKEINQMAKLLLKLDSLPKETGDGKNSKSIFLDTAFQKKIEDYPYFEYVFWMDTVGKVTFEYTSSRTEDSRIDESDNYGSREYFKAVANKTDWYVNIKGLDGKKMYLESILSWTNGTNSAVLAMPTPWRPNAVIAMSVQMHSIIDAVFPPGYQFHIIDKSGKVLFNSDKSHNLQENYLEECLKNKNISSALVSNTSLYTDVTYYHQGIRTFVQPMEDVPWYLVVTYDTRYSGSPFSLIIIYTLFSSLALSILVGFLCAVVAILYQRTSKLKKRIFPFEWLRPKREMEDKYIWVLILNGVYLFLLFFYNILEETNAIQSFISFGCAIILLYTFSFALLQEQSWRYRLFINIIFFSVGCLFVVLAFVQGIAMVDFVLIGGLLVLWLVVMKNADSPILKRYIEKVKAFLWVNDFKKAYVLMMFSFLIINGFASTVFLYTKFYEQERFVWEKSVLHQLHQQLEKKEHEIQNKYASAFKESNETIKGKAESLLAASNRLGLHFEELGYREFPVPLGKEKAKTPLKKLMAFIQHKQYFKWGKEADSPTSKYEEVVSHTRPFLNQLIRDNNGFVFAKSGGQKWEVAYMEHSEESENPSNQAKNNNNLYFTYDRSPENMGQRILAGTKPLYFNWDGADFQLGNFIYLIILLLVIVVVYNGLKLSLRDFYTWGLISRKEILQIDDKEFSNRKSGEEISDISRNVFLITLPFAGLQALQHPKNKLLEYLSLVKTNLKLSQLYDEDYFKSQVKKAKSLKNEIVVLEHFGYNIKDMQVSSRKLQLLELLLLNGNKVAIVSGVRPLQIMELYEKQIEDYKLSSAAEKEKIDISKVHDQLNRWKDILSGFVKIYTGSDRERRLNMEGSVQDLIHYECKASSYFLRLKPFLFNLPEDILSSNSRAMKEDVLLKIQSMAQPFYFSLWNTCSKEEKYLLYDLAADDFVNTKNSNCIMQLIEKGLIFNDDDDRLHIMNESFRNFILTNIKESEALEMENEVVRNGTYSIFKAVIILVAISALLFVSFAEQALLESVIAVLAGVTALIPAFLRLSGWFSPSTEAKA